MSEGYHILVSPRQAHFIAELIDNHLIDYMSANEDVNNRCFLEDNVLPLFESVCLLGSYVPRNIKITNPAIHHQYEDDEIYHILESTNSPEVWWKEEDKQHGHAK